MDASPGKTVTVCARSAGVVAVVIARIARATADEHPFNCTVISNKKDSVGNYPGS
jgi:hypothetical protein